MTHVSEFVTEVRSVGERFSKRMPEHQRLVYAVEAVVAGVLPSATVSLHGAREFVDAICADLGVNTPEVIVKNIRGFTACASHDAYTIVLSKDTISTMVLCHELAHLLCDESEGHHDEWRTTFVRLARRFISVEHGALLHTLYNRCDLPTAWS